MSLATRCPACGTIFRVVQDQLKVSEGWVRCGRCQEVFNALPNLFDLDREPPPPWPVPTPEQPVPPGAWDATRPVSRGAVHGPALDDGSDDDQPEPPTQATQPLLRTASREAAAPEPAEDDAEAQGFANARFNLDLLDDDPHGEPPEDDRELPELERLASRFAFEPTPEFVRQADRQARWRHPAMLAGLWIGLLAGVLALAVQAALYWRGPLLAQWPGSQALLSPVCEALGCRLEPPRLIDSVVVDSTGLSPLAAPGQYKLSVVLHNHARGAVLLPSIELSLTDAEGQLIARKDLAPTDMGTVQTSLAGGADLSLQALLDTGAQRAVGYTVEIFYP